MQEGTAFIQQILITTDILLRIHCQTVNPFCMQYNQYVTEPVVSSNKEVFLSAAKTPLVQCIHVRLNVQKLCNS
jgi:hypothetical protein